MKEEIQLFHFIIFPLPLAAAAAAAEQHSFFML
jgi:hypothetical protein